MPSSQPWGTHAFRPSLAASVNTSINTDPDDGGNEQGPSSQSISQPISQTYMDVSNTFTEGSGEIVDDRMSPDHDIEMPLGSPQLPSNSISAASLSFLSTPPLPPIISPPEILPDNPPLPTSTNSGSVSSGNSKRKFSAVAGQGASVTSSKKKAAKRASRADATAASNVTQAVAYHGFQGLINCLTDVFADLVTSTQQDLAHAHMYRDRALKLVWQVDDGLFPEEKVWVAICFHEQFSCSSFLDG